MPSIPNANVKRELWKVKGKNQYYSVARVKGKIVSREKWTQKEPVQKLQRQFKKTGTFKKDIIRKNYTNVRETTDYSSKPKVPKDIEMFSYVVTGTLKDGTIITARSMQHPRGYPVSKARAEALESFYERVSNHFNPADYDEEKGRKLANKGAIRKIKEGVVYYEKRTL